MSTSLPSHLFDKRRNFFQGYFEKAQNFTDFIQSGPEKHGQRWQSFLSKVSLSPDQENLLRGFTRQMNILVLAGLWCGDCARQCPMIELIARASKNISLKFIDNETYPELRDELRIHGASRVPLVVTLSEDFLEINRFGERPLSAYRRKAATELGPACEIGIAPAHGEELQNELADWIAHFERLQLMLRLSPLLRERYRD